MVSDLPITNISCYKFAPLSDLKSLRESLQVMCKERGLKGTILLSTDAISWVQQTSNTGNDLYALATNGTGGYVAVGRNGTILSSADGQVWNVQTSGTTNDLHVITYGNGIWIAVGRSGTLLASLNAVNWSAIASNTTQNLKGVTYGVAVNSTTLVATMG